MNEKNYIYKALDVKQKIIETSKERETYNTPEKVATLVNELLEINESSKEHFVMVGFNSHLQVNVVYRIHTGTLNSSIVHPREAFQVAILNNCHSVIFAHNHPGNKTKPSEADLITTARLVACGHILQIEVLDHIIITSDDFISIDEIGHMPDVSPEDIFDFM